MEKARPCGPPLKSCFGTGDLGRERRTSAAAKRVLKRILNEAGGGVLIDALSAAFIIRWQFASMRKLAPGKESVSARRRHCHCIHGPRPGRRSIRTGIAIAGRLDADELRA